MKNTEEIDARLRAALLLGGRVEGDRLMLADEVIVAALDGSRHLTEGERKALDESPLTLRRFRTLAVARSARDAWTRSQGMLRAASGGEALTALATDDGHWTLHFVDQPDGWRVILALDAGAPFAAHLLREQPMLRVVDGGGAIILLGSLDADGECESAWPSERAGAALSGIGAGFSVEPVH